ncbi:hypothetical protein SAMN02949497_3935 [Methylomagnum ishizawai]|uniref:Uncharacterized protein n=1 Tax=Methylomagnum ishizawai TaxID=1760988 RepID=A0A1Y6D9Z8_9GAMM|nr:hypothetical protein [Methylomagnum ishizawai]SMF96535.1 hypothetical protein SAMN02949497_3935 [Methylomagnum ishizawai]
MAKVTRLPTKRPLPPGALNRDEIHALTEAANIIKWARNKCREGTALHAELAIAYKTLQSAICSWLDMIEGGGP